MHGNELTKKLLRLVIEPEMPQADKTSVFQILINIVQDKAFSEECVKFNAANKVFDFLKVNVKQDIGEAGANAKLIDYKATEEGGTTKMYEVDSNFSSPIQCAFMFLTNLTTTENGQTHLLGEGKTKGLILENIFGMFQYFKTNTTFDFVANIFANVSSLKLGRQYIVESGLFKQVLSIVQQIDEISTQRRKHLLACIRNVTFEYEKYEKDFQQMELLETLVKLLVQEQGIAHLPPAWEHLNGICKKEKFLK